MRLNELVHSKDEVLAAKEIEIEELKKQLAGTTTEKDQHSKRLAEKGLAGSIIY